MGPHSCPTCSTRFFTSSALVEHAKVHIVGANHTVSTQDAASQRQVGPALSPDLSATSSAENFVTHNSQEVTAGQALLTLMDSNGNGVPEDPEPRGEGCPNDCSRPSAPSEASDSDGSEVPVPLHFEFCDVPLDLKSSIYLKEECFDFEDNLPNTTQKNTESVNTDSENSVR